MADETGEEHDQRADRVLAAVLPNVAFEGWTARAMRAAFAEAGLSEAEGELLFPDGAAGMIAHWFAWTERQMLAAMEATPTDATTPTERLVLALQACIDCNASHREAVRRTLAFLALPTNAALALRLGWRAVDALSYAAGDAATDFRFYSRRVALGLVCAATLFFWLDDDSEDFVDTRAFIERRMQGLDGLGPLRPSLSLQSLVRPIESLVGRVWRPRTE
jgi:ubiquinone biosynthesis protein COQ9